MHENQKFLIAFFQSLTHKQWFFLGWALIVAVFSGLILSFYKSTTRRNFKEGEVKGTGLVPKKTDSVSKRQ